MFDGAWPVIEEVAGFSHRWQQLGLSDKELWRLQAELIANPKAGPAVKGTGGLRKLRFPLESKGKGRRGGLRVCYADLTRHGRIVLVLVYSKDESDEIPDDTKAVIRKLLKQIERRLEVATGRPAG